MCNISSYIQQRKDARLLHGLILILIVLLISVWSFMVNNFSIILIWLSHLLHNSAGLSIIILTILVRLCLTPLIFLGNKKSQREIDLAPIYAKYEQKYNTYDVPTLEKLFTKRHRLKERIGLHHPFLLYLLPLLIEMFILDMFYQAVRITPTLSNNTFWHIPMNQASPTIWLPLIATVLTFLEQLLIKYVHHSHNRLSLIMLFGYPLWVLAMGRIVRVVLIVYWIGIYSAIIFQNLVFYSATYYHKHFINKHVAQPRQKSSQD